MAKKKSTAAQAAETVNPVEFTSALATTNAKDEISNGVVTMSQSDIAKAVGFDYSKQISMLTPAQRKEYLAKASSIKEDDITSIQMYGSELTKNIENNGNDLLSSVRSNNSNNEANMLINNLLAELKMVDTNDLSTTKLKRVLRKIPGIRNIIMTADKLVIKYDTIKNNVDQISARIKNHKIIAARDNNTLEIIFNNNQEYIHDIRELIIAAKIKDEELSKHITYMQERPDEYSPINVHDAQNFQNALEKRIANMQIAEYVFNQNLFQIRAIQNNNMAISDRAEAITSTVIPMWKNQLSMSVIMCNQQESIELQKRVANVTNELVYKNAELMKQNTINVARANEETIVSLETLKKSTNAFIETLTEVKKIQAEGAKMRETLEKNLVEYGTELTNRINELNADKKK